MKSIEREQDAIFYSTFFKTHLLSTLGKSMDVNQPSPLTNKRSALESLAGASETTSLTSSIFKSDVLKEKKRVELFFYPGFQCLV